MKTIFFLAVLFLSAAACNPEPAKKDYELLNAPACILYKGQPFVTLGMSLQDLKKTVNYNHEVTKHGSITDSQYFIEDPYYNFSLPGRESFPISGIVRFHVDEEEETITGVYATINTEDLNYGENYDSVVREAVNRYFPCFKGMEEKIASGGIVSINANGLKQSMHVITDAAPRKGRTLMYEAEYGER
jgi:hypothetical protein